MAPSDTAADTSSTLSVATPDASIDYAAALDYWNSIPSTVNGMLGGYPQITKVDLQGSANFLSKLRRQHAYATAPSSPMSPTDAPLLPRATDCGAGIGRITRGFLVNVAARVDVVEPVKKFTDELVAATVVKAGNRAARVGEVGEVFNLGLQDWTPAKGAYNLIWNSGVWGILLMCNWWNICGGVRRDLWLHRREETVTRSSGHMKARGL